MLPSKPTNPAGQVPHHTGVGVGTGNTNGSGVQIINSWLKNNDHNFFYCKLGSQDPINMPVYVPGWTQTHDHPHKRQLPYWFSHCRGLGKKIRKKKVTCETLNTVMGLGPMAGLPFPAH